MKIGIRLPLAYQIILLIELYKKTDEKINSVFLEKHTGADSTIIRQVMKILKDAGIIESKMGPTGGLSLTRDLSEITVGEVFRAFEGNELSMVFYFTAKPPTLEDISGHRAIHDCLALHYATYMESMNNQSMADLFNDYLKTEKEYLKKIKNNK